MKTTSIGGLARLVILAGLASTTWAAQLVDATIVNTPTVRELNLPTSNAFQVQLCHFWPLDCNGVSSRFTVPAGKKLVIEYVSGDCLTTDTTTTATYAQVLTSVNGVFARHLLGPVSFIVSGNGRNSYLLAQSTRLYADAGTAVSVGGYSFGTGSVGCLVTLSGSLASQ